MSGQALNIDFFRDTDRAAIFFGAKSSRSAFFHTNLWKKAIDFFFASIFQKQ